MRNIESGMPLRTNLERTLSSQRPLSMYQLYEQDEKLATSDYSMAVKKAKSLKGKNKIAALREAVDFEITSDIDLENKTEFLERLTAAQSNYRKGSYLHNKVGELITRTQNNISHYQHQQDLKEAEQGIQRLIESSHSRFKDLERETDDSFSALRQRYAQENVPTKQTAPVSPSYAFDLVSKATANTRDSQGPISRAIRKVTDIYSRVENNFDELNIGAKAAAIVLGAATLAGTVKVGVNKLQYRSNQEEVMALRDYENKRAQVINTEENKVSTLVYPLQNSLSKALPIQTAQGQEVIIKPSSGQYSVAWYNSSSSEEKPVLISSNSNQLVEYKISSLQKLFSYESPANQATILTPQPQGETSQVYAIKDRSSMGLISGEDPENSEFPFGGLIASDALGRQMWNVHQGREKTPQKMQVTTASSKPTYYELVTIDETKDPRTVRPVAFISTSTVKHPLLTAERRRRQGAPQGKYLELMLGQDDKRVRPVIYISTN